MADCKTMTLVEAIEYIRNDEAHAAALAGLQEAREVLQMLAQWPSQTCWCRTYRDRGDAHDEKCQRARELMKRLEVK